MQALRVLKEMQQRKAFTSLLAVSLAEAGKVNDKALAARMRCLDLSMHIAAGTLPEAWVTGQQVLCLVCMLCVRFAMSQRSLAQSVRCCAGSWS